MTDIEELRPISYRGLTNTLHALLGGGADYSPLHEQPIDSVSVEEDGELLVFRLVNGDIIRYSAEGDCCSHSWIEHITVPPDIAGAIITAFCEEEMGESCGEDECIRVYQTAFRSDRGEVVVEYRNSSNGYYGGWLQGPLEEWAKAEIDAAKEKP